MRNTILTALFVLLLGGCGVTRHEGKIEIFNAKGESTGIYVGTLDLRMEMKVVTANGDTVEINSKGESIIGQIFKDVFKFAMLGWIMDD